MTEADLEEIEENEYGLKGNSGINSVIAEHKEVIGYLIISTFILIVALVSCVMLSFSSGQTLVVIGIIALILALIYKKKEKINEKSPEESHEIGLKEGWLVTWADKWRHYMKAPKESTLLLVYGYYRIYDDGRIESLPDSFKLTFYKTNYMPMLFNPYIRGDIMIYQMIKEEYGEIAWADGTDRYLNAFERDLHALEVEA